VFAFDKCERRLDILKRRMLEAGAGLDKIVPDCRDFTKVDPSEPELSRVKMILLDPSCSGSGMMGRVDHLVEGEVRLSPDPIRSFVSSHVGCVWIYVILLACCFVCFFLVAFTSFALLQPQSHASGLHKRERSSPGASTFVAKRRALI